MYVLYVFGLITALNMLFFLQIFWVCIFKLTINQLLID